MSEVSVFERSDSYGYWSFNWPNGVPPHANEISNPSVGSDFNAVSGFALYEQDGYGIAKGTYADDYSVLGTGASGWKNIRTGSSELNNWRTGNVVVFEVLWFHPASYTGTFYYFWGDYDNSNAEGAYIRFRNNGNFQVYFYDNTGLLRSIAVPIDSTYQGQWALAIVQFDSLAPLVTVKAGKPLISSSPLQSNTTPYTLKDKTASTPQGVAIGAINATGGESSYNSSISGIHVFKPSVALTSGEIDDRYAHIAGYAVSSGSSPQTPVSGGGIMTDPLDADGNPIPMAPPAIGGGTVLSPNSFYIEELERRKK